VNNLRWISRKHSSALRAAHASPVPYLAAANDQSDMGINGGVLLLNTTSMCARVT
jgi:hypothetical protein